MAQRRIPTKNKSTLTVTFERTWWWAGIFLSDSDCPHHRTKARRQSCQRLYPEALSRPESWQRKSHLFPLHMCYRHREYPLCVCCCERHNSTTKPEGIQPGVKAAGHPSPGPENQIRFICKRSSSAHWVASSPSCSHGDGWWSLWDVWIQQNVFKVLLLHFFS